MYASGGSASQEAWSVVSKTVQYFPERPVTVTEAEGNVGEKLPSKHGVEMEYAIGLTSSSELLSVKLVVTSESEKARLPSSWRGDDAPAVELPSPMVPLLRRQEAALATAEASSPSVSILNEGGPHGVKGASGNSDSVDSSASFRRFGALSKLNDGIRSSDFWEAATDWHLGVSMDAMFGSRGVEIKKK
mmetsp:Transcript_16476/g.32204  ORF Transcript_16476/g.32204 Transcript_16476/m.32204 type:complete len:189 (+) Transcript_16476:143-709(+)|eukprot:CAMPEP_0172745410 /NCGR_PEP_ID=MMETSP1074-20121228/137838_1 /TAXON_ID=2916 /ORGANISM="Ceratium fusus, Strain PA161109" /LENGTH=188 /DNA_ID=CAMNT_0013576573 /DNA_START=205 /DNA_END=771 /DNA_ORIENTATION=-